MADESLDGAERDALLIELGVTGLRQYSGQIVEEFLPILRGRRGMFVYREMSNNDPVVGSFLFAVEMLIRQVPWTVEPASDEPEDVDRAEFLESCLYDMDDTWQD